MYPIEDATLDFYSALSDPARWEIKPGVPIFKPHVRTDPATGQVIKVDLPKLYRIAANMQRLERLGGVPIRLTLGHTEPGKPETEQPPVGGYYRNPRVARFGPKGEPAVVVDEWLDPQYKPVRKNFPYRSAEYYDDAEQITGVALLTRDPYLDLGVVAYSRGGVVGYSRPLRGPVHYSANGRPRPGWEFTTTGGDDAMWPTDPNNPFGAYAGPAVPGTYPTAPAPYPPPQYGPVYPPAAPTPYAAPPVPPTRYDTAFQWPYVPPMGVGNAGWDVGNPYSPHRIGHPHPSGGAIYDHTGQHRGSSGVGHHGPEGMQHPRPGYTHHNPHFHPGSRSEYADDPAAAALAGGAVPPPMPGMTPPPMPGMQMPGMPGYCPPGMMPPGMPGAVPGAGPSDDPLAALHQSLGSAVEHLSRYLSGRHRRQQYGAQAPTSPFPYADDSSGFAAGAAERRREEEERRRQAMASATGDPFRSRIAPHPHEQVSRADRDEYARYQAAHAPLTTISGQPVGYQLKVDSLQYQLRQSQDALRVLMYERDQSDTQWCVAEIRRLADAGYPVGEYEIHELKAKPRQQREAYLYHVATKYAHVPTEYPPPILGDPTPGSADGPAGPATQEEMEMALRLSANNPDPAVYSQALNYVRSGGRSGVNYGPAGFGGPPPAAPFDPRAAAWGPGAAAPQSAFDPADPYPEPSANGNSW